MSIHCTLPTPFHPRFELRRHLGHGGMGLVDEVLDHTRGHVMALKRPVVAAPGEAARLIAEYRALAQLDHRNIVAVHELIRGTDGCGFTMEAIDGVDLLTAVRGATSALAVDTAETANYPTEPAVHGGTTLTDKPRARRPGPPSKRWRQGPLLPEQLDRLRATVSQLAHALSALAEASLVHRDVKPSNVLVTPHGRVVLIDFGIATVVGAPGDPSRDTVLGTPEWMAPEQIEGEPVTTATDAYGVGSLLFAALAGRPPFSGARAAIMRAKTELDAPRVGDLVAGVPRELDDLVAGLLAREPAARPSLRDVTLVFGHAAAMAA